MPPRVPARLPLWPLTAALLLAGGGLVALAVSLASAGPDRPARPAGASPASGVLVTHLRRPARPPRPRWLRERPAGRLGTPVQDAALTRVPGGALLLAGLTAADTSRADVALAHAGGDRFLAKLRAAEHDAAAVTLGGRAYLL